MSSSSYQLALLLRVLRVALYELIIAVQCTVYSIVWNLFCLNVLKPKSIKVNQMWLMTLRLSAATSVVDSSCLCLLDNWSTEQTCSKMSDVFGRLQLLNLNFELFFISAADFNFLYGIFFTFHLGFPDCMKWGRFLYEQVRLRSMDFCHLELGNFDLIGGAMRVFRVSLAIKHTWLFYLVVSMHYLFEERRSCY